MPFFNGEGRFFAMKRASRQLQKGVSLIEVIFFSNISGAHS